MKTKMFIRATTLTVSVAVVMLTLTLMPRTAAAALMCVPGAGSSINCTVVPGSCSSWDETSGASGPSWCFDAATVNVVKIQKMTPIERDAFLQALSPKARSAIGQLHPELFKRIPVCGPDEKPPCDFGRPRF